MSKGDARLRHYLYGVHFRDTGGHGQQLVTYVVKESKGSPAGALITRTYYGTASGAEEKARDLLETYINGEVHLETASPAGLWQVQTAIRAPNSFNRSMTSTARAASIATTSRTSQPSSRSACSSSPSQPPAQVPPTNGLPGKPGGSI